MKILVAAGSLLSWGNLRKTNPSLCPCTHHDCHELCGRRAEGDAVGAHAGKTRWWEARAGRGHEPLLGSQPLLQRQTDGQGSFTDSLVGPRPVDQENMVEIKWSPSRTLKMAGDRLYSSHCKELLVLAEGVLGGFQVCFICSNSIFC